MSRVGLLAQVLLGVLVVAGAAATVVLLGAGALADVPRERTAALVVGAMAAALTGVLVVAFRALRRRSRAGAPPDLASDLDLVEGGATVQLRPRARKWIPIGSICLLFLVVAAPFAIAAPGFLTISSALFCTFGLVVSILQFVPGMAHLRVSPEGFEVRSPFVGRRYAWNDVDDFRVFEIQTRYRAQRMVGFDLRERTPERQTLWQTINRGMSGIDVALPDTYGLDPKDLARSLDRLRRRYATVRGTSPSERADRQLRRMAERVDTSRRPVVTWVLGVGCVVVFAIELAVAGLQPDPGELLDLGGATGGAPWWTLVTANLLHAGPVHLALNLLAWAFCAALLEREVGWPRMAILCAAGGVSAMGLAILLQPQAVTVGLSGVLFAALGAAVVRDPHSTRTLGAVAWSVLPISFIYTFFSPGTSIGAHLGGIAVGVAFGRAVRRAS